MDTVLFSGDIYHDQAAMEARVVTFAVRTYQDQVAPDLLERWAREAVAEIWGDGPNVTKFVPMLALRQVREHVNDYSKHRAAARHEAEERPHTSLFPEAHRPDHGHATGFAFSSTKFFTQTVQHPPIREARRPQQQRVREQTA